MLELNDFFEEVFANNTDEQIIDAINNGLDPEVSTLNVAMEHGKADIPGLSSDYTSVSFFGLDYNPDILQDMMFLPQE